MFFMDMYNFLYLPMYKKPFPDLELCCDEVEVIETEEGKIIVIQLCEGGVVLNKIKFLVGNYLKNVLKKSNCPTDSVLEILKNSTETGKELFILEKQTH